MAMAQDDGEVGLPFFRQYTAESAKRDLQEGTAGLIIVGGNAATVYIGQEEFKKKYGVDYNDFGCIPECSEQQMRLYNYTIFDWLNKEYGKQWQKEVRKDVVGLEKWKKYQDAVPYELCETKPTFEGGTANDYNLWVINHMRVAPQDKVSGRICINVLISERGKVIDIDDMGIKDDDPLADAYIKAAKEAPKWTPGRHDGKPCKVKLMLPVHIDYR